MIRDSVDSSLSASVSSKFNLEKTVYPVSQIAQRQTTNIPPVQPMQETKKRYSMAVGVKQNRRQPLQEIMEERESTYQSNGTSVVVSRLQEKSKVKPTVVKSNIVQITQTIEESHNLEEIKPKIEASAKKAFNVSQFQQSEKPKDCCGCLLWPTSYKPDRQRDEHN